MDQLHNINTMIRVLERLKKEPHDLQEDALWKLGDLLTEAIDVGRMLNEEKVYQQLLAFHQEINENIQFMDEEQISQHICLASTEEG